LAACFPHAEQDRLARTFWLPKPGERPAAAGKVVVVTAGTSDLPVAREALVTASVMGAVVELVVDVGVAGLHRILRQRERLASADVVIVVAGMDGALPSVVGGLVDCPVIACPTSIGYGAAFGGVAALLTMLNSCSAGVCVVNIDAGFKAGYVAARFVKRMQKHNAQS
jgi:NCAIR mutase (PurE)-related protein